MDNSKLNNRTQTEQLSHIAQKLNFKGDSSDQNVNALWKCITPKNSSCILEIHCGAGGLDACDWAKMLYEMYIKYLNKQGYQYEICNVTEDAGGIRSAMLHIQLWHELLIQESGVHKLIRVSPFSKAKKRHTSFASVEVYPYVETPAIQINEKDIRWDTFRSSGAGGQHVNTTDSAVRATHIPTGIVAQCQNQRSQLQNKQVALRILYNKIVAASAPSNKYEELGQISWGNHFRTYTIYPHRVFKDNRLNIHLENDSVIHILNGDLDQILNIRKYTYLVQKYGVNNA